MKQEGKR